MSRSWSHWLSFWRVTLLACAVGITLVDAVLMGAATGLLTTGFNGPRIGGAAFALAFVPASLLLDAWLVVCLWIVAVPLTRRLFRSPAQATLAAALVGLGVPALLTVARYNVISVLGAFSNPVRLKRFATWESSGMVVDTLLDLPVLWLAVTAGLAGVLAALRLSRAVEASLGDDAPALKPPAVSRLARLGAGLTLASLLTVAGVYLLGSPFRLGFERKASGQLAKFLLDELSDLDRDGYGALSRPADPAALDADVYPFATDRPGNGIDENGLAGDHPTDFALAGTDFEALQRETWQTRPHLLLIYLESFQAGLIEKDTPEGRPVTPFLRSLAVAGNASDHAYVHSPWTLDSRAQLFSGRISPVPGESTLIDDLLARGYTVAYLSGQDESYGKSEEVLGTGRAHHFYDARADAERRTSRTTAPVSLQVSWKTLLGRVREFLDGWDGEGPLFLYVNVVDTHFPYWHDEIDDLLGVPPLLRSQIRARNEEHVRRAYDKTARNVDVAVDRIVAAFRKKIGEADHGILVTADHGQALYENGLLGHGRSLDALLTQVPFLVWGIGGEWPEPIGPTDVRALIARNLGRARVSGKPPRARFVQDPSRRLFQYAPSLARPAFLGAQGVADRLEFVLHRGKLRRVPVGGGAPRQIAERGADFERLVWQWERLVSERSPSDEGQGDEADEQQP